MDLRGLWVGSSREREVEGMEKSRIAFRGEGLGAVLVVVVVVVLVILRDDDDDVDVGNDGTEGRR